MRLTTFAMSHFSEKARWACDANGLAYEERRLLPGLHIPVVRLMAKAKTVPVLEHDGEIIQGSSAILDYLEQRLGKTALAAPAGAELEALADEAFGVATQQIFYDAFLREPATVIGLWSHGGPSWSRTFYRVVFPVMAREIRSMYRITPATIVSAKDAMARALDRTDRILETSPFLLGEKLSRVDVTVASLLGPWCSLAETIVRWPPRPESLGALLDETRPTLALVRRMYREHRARPG